MATHDVLILLRVSTRILPVSLGVSLARSSLRP